MEYRYRRAGGHARLWVGTFILAMGSGLGVGLLLSRKIGGLAFVLSALIFGGAFFVGMALVGRRHHARKRNIRRYLEREGYTFELSPTLDSFGSLAFLIEWADWGKWIAARELKWVARTEGRLLMEREFVIMASHDELVENNKTLGFVLDPACTRLKGLQLARAAGNQWRHADGRHKSVQVGDAQFDREWVTTRDGDVPVEQALSAGIRQALSKCPQGESKGRFKTDPKTGEPLLLSDPEGVLVWHSTRVDDAGRLAMTRLDADLKPVWKAELPLSETDLVRQVATWLVPGHLVVVGQLQTASDGVHRRTLQAATIELKTGALRTMDLAGNAASR